MSLTPASSSAVVPTASLPELRTLPQGQETNRHQVARDVVGVSADCAVSAIRQAESELDEVIRDLATLAALAEDRGDVLTAMDYSRRMAAAIKSRTPEHIQRLEQAAWQRSNRKEWAEVLGEVGEHPGCFFDVCGAAIRRRMG
jgi:hypothetical protein